MTNYGSKNMTTAVKKWVPVKETAKIRRMIEQYDNSVASDEISFQEFFDLNGKFRLVVIPYGKPALYRLTITGPCCP